MDSVEFCHVIKAEPVKGFPLHYGNQQIGHIDSYIITSDFTYVNALINEQHIPLLFKQNAAIVLDSNTSMGTLVFKHKDPCLSCKWK